MCERQVARCFKTLFLRTNIFLFYRYVTKSIPGIYGDQAVQYYEVMCYPVCTDYESTMVLGACSMEQVEELLPHFLTRVSCTAHYSLVNKFLYSIKWQWAGQAKTLV